MEFEDDLPMEKLIEIHIREAGDNSKSIVQAEDLLKIYNEAHHFWSFLTNFDKKNLPRSFVDLMGTLERKMERLVLRIEHRYN